MAPPSSSLGLMKALLPLMIAVFTAFLIIGIALPVLPLHVHYDLGFGNFAVGVIAGGQFAASLVSRIWAGDFADGRGAKLAVVIGLIGAALSGLLYVLSLLVRDATLALAILFVARTLLGAGESFVITGAVSWGMVIGGPLNTGKVIAWIGMAMYAAFAVGAPLGGVLYDAWGFWSVATATTVIPACVVLILLPLPAVAPQRKAPSSILSVLRMVWLPGAGLAMASFGFGAMMTFTSLLFSQRGWTPVWLGLSTFAASFIVARVLFGHVADRVGGGPVALLCLIIQALGLAMVGLSSWETLAVVGTILTGFGYSLVYPGLGLEAVHRAPPESRGLAMGAYTAFLDLALGLFSPLLGLLGAQAGTDKVFVVAAAVTLMAVVVPFALMRGAPGSERG